MALASCSPARVTQSINSLPATPGGAVPSRTAFMASWLTLGGAAFAQEPGPGTEVEELSLDDLDALDATETGADGGVTPVVVRPAVATEHEYDRKLLVFPLLLAAALAWNVKWKKDTKK